MKSSNLSKLLGTALLTGTLAVVPLTLHAEAQTNDAGTSTQTNTDVSNSDTNQGFDWGWLGLLGLLGLAGLAGKRKEPTVYRDTTHDPNVGTRSDIR
jgi:cytochrome oxidase assembly protein ShyY1